MSKTGNQFKKEIQSVLEVQLTEIAEGNELLLTAMLYGSDPMETHKIIDYYDADSSEMRAARLCLAFHSDAEKRHRAILLEFFSDNVKAMINFALANLLHGARLMPVFCTYATYAEEHDIDDELKGAVVEIMEYLRAEMGFAITEITPTGGEIVLADEVVDCEEVS